jgi:small subunit ribosomal protein S20
VAHSLSAQKRIRQNETNRQRNQARRSVLKTQIRKFEDALKSKDVAKAEEEFRKTTKKLDQVASTSTLHKNAASRTKSRLAKRLNAVKAKA